MRTLALAAALFYLGLAAVTQVLLTDIGVPAHARANPVAVASR